MDTTSLRKRICLALFDASKLAPSTDYRIHDQVITPYLYVLSVKPLVDTRRFTSDGVSQNIKLAAEHLSKNEHVSIDIHRGFVVIQIPLPESERGAVAYTSDHVPAGSGLRVGMGLDVLNMPVYHDFRQDMHTSMSFLGVAGSGKSFSQRRVITSLAANNSPGSVKFLMIEVSKAGEDLRLFSNLPHLAHEVITEPEMAEHALNWVVAQLMSDARLPYKLFVCIDELSQLIQRCPATIDLLVTLISQGRARGVYVLVAQQLTDKNTLTVIDGGKKRDGSAVFSQIHCGVIGKLTSATQSYGLAKLPQLRAEYLCGNGDLILKSTTTVTRFAGVYTTAEDLRRINTGYNGPSIPLEHYTNTDAVLDDAKRRGRPREMIPDDLVAAGLIEMQHLDDDPTYREQMLGRDFWLMNKTQVVKEFNRDANTFRDRDQHYIRQLYIKLRKRGFRLCGGK